MYSGRRRWLARSNSEPPFPAAWALQQPPPSAADEHPKSPSGCSGSEPSPSGDDQQAERGRPLKRESQVDTVTMEQSKSHGHAVGAGLNGDAANNAAEATRPKDESINAYPEKLGRPASAQTFWIPFRLTPMPGGISGTGRLTPINRRVPPHLRAAASALNLKMTYTKIGTGDYILSHGSTPAVRTPAPGTPHNERAPKADALHTVVQGNEKKANNKTPLAQTTNDGVETHDAPEADLPAPPVAAPSTREVSASTSGESSDTSEEPFIQTVPIAGDHACDEAIPIEETRQPVEAVDLSRPSPPSVPEQPDAGPMIEALPVPVAAQEESKPPIIHAAPDVAPEAVPAIPVETERPRDECVKVDDDKADEPPACEVEKDVVPPASKERDVPAHEDDAPRQDPPIGPVEPSLLPPVIQAPSIAPALPATANSSAQSTVRENPESKSIHHSKRASLKGPIEHILNAHVEKPSTPLVPPPMAIVGVPRARSNTVADHAVPVPARTSSRPAAMRATASRVHAQLAVAGAADLEPDTDGEPSWAWDELNRQLDEEEDRKRRAHYRPLADGTVNLDAWWIAFELAWEANMRRGRGVRTWWDLEKYWKPSEVFAAEDDASHPIPETKTEKPVAEDKEAKVGGHEGSNTNVNGEQTLVSSSERSPRRSDSRNSLKTLAAPGTNQSKRGAAPQTEQARPATKEIPEESAGHTTPTSLSSSITSSRSSSRSSSKSRRNETDPKVTSDSQQAEPILRSSDFRTMWAEAERRWAEQEKVTSGNKDSVKDTQLPKTNMDGTTPPEVKPSADDRERARGRSREERPQSRTNTRPPIFQRGDYAPEDGHHKRQKEQEQFNVYAQSVPAQPNMFSRRQSEPSLRAAETDPNDGLLRGRRGRNARPKLHIDTDLTDYTQSAPRMPKAKAKAQQQPHVQPVPQIHSQPPPQAQPQNQPPPQARPVPPQHSQSHTQQQSSRAQPQSQPKPHSRPGGRAPPPPVMLRAIPVASDRTQSRIAVAWRAYEARWESMLALSSRELITFATIPWPVLHPPKSYADGDGLAALSTLSIAQFLLSPDHSPGIPARDRLRAAIRKWHSDKFNRFVARMRSDDGEDEAGRIMEGVGVVARALTQLLELERGD